MNPLLVQINGEVNKDPINISKTRELITEAGKQNLTVNLREMGVDFKTSLKLVNAIHVNTRI